MAQQPQRVPTPTLERMATYLACLLDLGDRGVQTVSSAEVEHLTDVNAAQFRKDLSYFGDFGRPGIGYSVQELTRRISEILKVDKEQPVLLVGAGNLGSALSRYIRASREHFRVAGVFDNDVSKVGRKLNNLPIRDIATMAETNRNEFRAKIGIVVVPAPAAQAVADQLVAAGVTAILNFAPVSLRLPPGVKVRNVDFVQELAVLSYHLAD